MSQTAVVCRANQMKPAAVLFPDAKLIHPLEAVNGHRFDRIIVLFKPEFRGEAEWVAESLRCRLKCVGEWLDLAS